MKNTTHRPPRPAAPSPARPGANKKYEPYTVREDSPLRVLAALEETRPVVWITIVKAERAQDGTYNLSLRVQHELEDKDWTFIFDWENTMIEKWWDMVVRTVSKNRTPCWADDVLEVKL